MLYNDRINLYRKVEKLRGRPLIVYVTSCRPFADAQMGSDVLPEITKQILSIPKEKKEVDLLIVSNGGDPIVSWRIISLLRERFDKIGALIPSAAYSAATLLALGADEIVMHDFANLGPVDPQFQIPDPYNKEKYILFGAEDLKHYIDFARHDVGISDQEQVEKVFELICKDVNPTVIGVAKRSSHLTLSMAEKLLKSHMDDDSKIKPIAEALNKSFYHHGYPLGKTEAKAIGLPVADSDGELEDLIWQIWASLESEMQCNVPFDIISIAMNDPANAKFLETVPQVVIPANLPQDLLQQAYNNILSQIRIIPAPPVKFEIFIASVESIRCYSQFRPNGIINAVRMPDLSIKAQIVFKSYNWIHEESPKKSLEVIAAYDSGDILRKQ